MEEVVTAKFPTTDVAVMVAAVSDYYVANRSDQKIKKQHNESGLKLELAEQAVEDEADEHCTGEIDAPESFKNSSFRKYFMNHCFFQSNSFATTAIEPRKGEGMV